MDFLKKLFDNNYPSIQSDTMEVVTSSYPKVVQQIHTEFMTAGDMLLQKANAILDTLTIDNVEKSTKLRELGFSKTKDVQTLEEVSRKREEQEKIAQAVTEYRVTYPNYKYISDDIAKKICKKYGLVLGHVGQYKGFVPQKNLSDIEKFFKVHPDFEFQYFRHYSGSMYGDMLTTKESYDSYMDERKSRKETSVYHRGLSMQQSSQVYATKTVLNICAPLSDMDTEGYTKKGHLLVKNIPDPVVLMPLKHKNGVSGYLIVTAWGDEATDEMVVNQSLN